jgi:hypothetical protein
MKKKQALSLTSEHIKTKATATVLSPNGVRRDIEEKEKIVDLNFKVEISFRRRFKHCANQYDITNVELLRQALDAWEEKHRME